MADAIHLIGTGVCIGWTIGTWFWIWYYKRTGLIRTREEWERARLLGKEVG